MDSAQQGAAVGVGGASLAPAASEFYDFVRRVEEACRDALSAISDHSCEGWYEGGGTLLDRAEDVLSRLESDARQLAIREEVKRGKPVP